VIGSDNDVLVRYIMRGDAKQSPKSAKLVESLPVDESDFVSIVSVNEERSWSCSSCGRPYHPSALIQSQRSRCARCSQRRSAT
jgi:DNA-directed RNA polymerase subunit RPC12/RpoP